MDFTNVSSAFIFLPHDQSSIKYLHSLPEYESIVNRKSIALQIASELKSEGQFDIILALESSVKNNEDSIFRLLSPSGRLYLGSPVQDLSFSLKIAGFVAINEKTFMKPQYEMGSSVQVEQKKKVWTLDLDDDMGDDDLINDEDLLDEQDKVKPSAEELRVCETTKQRKACANCSCGLKEELEAEEVVKIKENSQNAKSSCGNCYLGDAFRCAGCPYRGLPAFKPGEKVSIDATSDDL